MSLRIRQVVVAARELETTLAQLVSVLGVRVCYRDPAVAKFGLENALMVIGDQILEVVSPTKDDTAAGRHLARHGDSGYMLIFQTDDLARDRVRLDALGVRIVWQASHDDISAIHLHPRDIGGAIVSIDQPVPPESWRWAGPDWPAYRNQRGAQRVTAATINARDPVALAARWAQVLGLPPATSSPGGLSLELTDGRLDFVAGNAEVIAGYTLTMPDPTGALAKARELGLPVDGDVVKLCGTRFSLSAGR